MITFLLSVVALIAGYLFYGRFVEHIFAPDDRPTPAITCADGIDYVAMPYWKVFMIQFLNIAGTGPIFGAIMGAKFGPLPICGLCLDVYLREPPTTTSPECSPCAMAAATFLPLCASILAPQLQGYCSCSQCSCL